LARSTSIIATRHPSQSSGPAHIAHRCGG